jgi:hypothetical protein
MSVWIADLNFVLSQPQQLNANDSAGRFKGGLAIAGACVHTFL